MKEAKSRRVRWWRVLIALAALLGLIIAVATPISVWYVPSSRFCLHALLITL